MRNPNRIPAELKRLEVLWSSMPEMRLSQLIMNAWCYENFYYKEDKEFIDKIIETHKDYKIQ